MALISLGFAFWLFGQSFTGSTILAFLGIGGFLIGMAKGMLSDTDGM